LVTAAPASPPINAWELLEGVPSHQVIKFQQMAPHERAENDRSIDHICGHNPGPNSYEFARLEFY
jgi:hypothetical protein